MTSRSDLPRLGASLGVLGTILERDGQTAWDRMFGWQFGPRKAPGLASDDVCRCGHSIESHIDGHDVCAFTAEDEGGSVRGCGCDGFVAAPQGAPSEDQATEQKQRQRAAEHFAELRSDLDAIDDLVQRLLRKIDIAVPPNPEEVKNRRTGEFEPWTPAEVELAGWCSSCWRHEQTFTAIYVDPKGMRRWKGSCSWCGPIRSQHKIDPPLELLARHLAGKNIPPEEFEAAMVKAKQSQQAPSKGKSKKAKRKKSKVAA